MTATTTSAIHSALATTLTALTGWEESRWPFDLLGMDPEQMLHKSFAVGIGPSEPLGELRRGGRQGTTAGVQVMTQVNVRFLYRIRADAMRSDYRSALSAETELVKATMANWPTGTHIIFRSVPDRQVIESGWFVGTISFDAHHIYALS